MGKFVSYLAFPVFFYKIFIWNVTFGWIMSIHKVTKQWEGTIGEPKGFPFGISMGKWDRNGAFPKETCELLVLRGTTSFCNNKITIFCLLEKVLCGMFKCAEMNNVEEELFRF